MFNSLGFFEKQIQQNKIKQHYFDLIFINILLFLHISYRIHILQVPSQQSNTHVLHRFNTCPRCFYKCYKRPTMSGNATI